MLACRAIYYAGTSYRIAVPGNYISGDLGGLHLANYGVGGRVGTRLVAVHAGVRAAAASAGARQQQAAVMVAAT